MNIFSSLLSIGFALSCLPKRYSHWKMKVLKKHCFGTFCDTKILVFLRQYFYFHRRDGSSRILSKLGLRFFPACIFQVQSSILSTSIYDLVLIYVCHFHHHHHHHPVIFLSNHGPSRYSCLHLGFCIQVYVRSMKNIEFC